MAHSNSPLDLGVLPIGKLLGQYAVPAIIAMTASSLYNMVDSIFIGHGVGALAISGLALTFPFMNLSAAFGAMVGVGASTLISVKLGQKDYESAQQIFGNVISLTIILGLAFTVVSLIFLDPILYFFGASEATLPYAREYMEIILAGNIITHSYLTLNSVLRSAGHPRLSMNATILAVVVNTILNPLFIYGLDMGIRGSATATILAQIISLLWQLHVFSKPDELIHFKRGTYKLRSKIDVAFPHEQLRLHHRHPHQPGIGTLRRRPGHRRVWHRQPPGLPVHHDCYRHQPRHAAHRGL